MWNDIEKTPKILGKNLIKIISGIFLKLRCFKKRILIDIKIFSLWKSFIDRIIKQEMQLIKHFKSEGEILEDEG